MEERRNQSTQDTSDIEGWAQEGRESRASDRRINPIRRRSPSDPGSRNESDTRKDCNEEEEENRKEKTVLKIPACKVVRVIGRQSTKIRELQSTTGTYIDVGWEECDGKVEICISGSSEGREKCREMILKWTEEPGVESLRRQVGWGKRENEEETISNADWDGGNKIADESEKQRSANLTALKKNFYVEASDVAGMSEEHVNNLRKSLNNITVNRPFGGTGKIPNPVETFNQAFACYPQLMDQLSREGFTKPFPIQCQAWPILLSGQDMIGIAETGTGKTLAFLLPAFIHTDGQETALSERGGPNVLILAPTRELALQIDGECKRFQYRDLKSVCLYDGGEREEQIRELEKGVQIVIATPGRLNDLVASSGFNAESITFLVLDEADRMLDMGFERQIRRTLMTLRPDRQTVMTSATWTYLIQNLAEKYMREPIKVVIGSSDLAAVHGVRQIVHIVEEEEKFRYLLNVISNLSPSDKIIIFVGRRALADSLSCELILKKIECQSIHGSREQSDREQAIDDLRTGVVRILVATDILNRGIDIRGVTKVVNYDFPLNMEDYVHRVGRTGNAGKMGESISFFTSHDREHAKELISILEEANQTVPEELHEMSKADERDRGKVRNEKCPRRGARNYAFGKEYRNQ